MKVIIVFVSLLTAFRSQTIPTLQIDSHSVKDLNITKNTTPPNGISTVIGNVNIKNISRPKEENPSASNNHPVQRSFSQHTNIGRNSNVKSSIPETPDGKFEEVRQHNVRNTMREPECKEKKEKTSRSLDKIYGFLQGVSEKWYNKALTRLIEIGKSYNGLPIYALKIHNKKSPEFSTIVVEFGIHAREWASTESAVFLIDQLLKERGMHIEKLRWFIVPVLNPDGYNYSMNVDDMWRKNRSPAKKECPGVDLNRNFGDHWSKELSEDECLETYSGTGPFSEPETQVMRDFVESIRSDSIAAYVAVHSCAQTILHPYGYTGKPPATVKLLKEVGQKMADKMYTVRSQTYSVQPSYRLAVRARAAGGGSDDYMYEHFKIPLVFTIELGDDGYLRTDNYDYCFHPHTYMLMYYLIKECHIALVTLADHIIGERENSEEHEERQLARRQPDNQAPSPSSNTIILSVCQLIVGAGSCGTMQLSSIKIK